MDETTKNAFYDILVEECEAEESMRDNFLYHFPECIEYRFQGNQGSGGKVWYNPMGRKPQSVYVSYYPEDEKWIDIYAHNRANIRLRELMWKQTKQ